MSDAKLKFAIFHGAVKVGKPTVSPDGKDLDGYARPGEVVELTAAQAKTMDPRGEILMPLADYEAAKKVAIANAELEHERAKREASGKKPPPLSRKVTTAMKALTEQALAELKKKDAEAAETKAAPTKK